MEDYKDKIKELEEENAKLKEHLKKYTAPPSRKEYYERNKEKEKQRVKEYQLRTNFKSTYVASPEKKKENTMKFGWFTGYYAVRAVVGRGTETVMVHQTSTR